MNTYIFDSASAQGREQVDHLRDLLDDVTTGFLAVLDPRPHWQCLDIGAGTGSVARWLADRVGADGRVVAIDIDTEQLDVPPQVEVYRHDICGELPVDGPFDLIHARLVLTHVPNREVVLRRLIDLLAPGGWIVLGETPDRPQEVLAAPTAADVQLAAYIAQLTPLLLDAGVSDDELDRYDALMRDPRFRAWPFLRLVTTAGRKPLEGEING